MNRFSLLIIVFSLLLYNPIQAQEEFSKLGLYTLRQIQSGEIKDNISLFIRGDLKAVEQLTLKHEGVYKFGYGSISSVTIPLNRLDLFLKSPIINEVESGMIKMQPLMDTALIVNNVLPIHQGNSPLPQGYTGKGVIVGVIDDGIYFDHPDFKDSLGNTRIRYIWDMTKPTASNTPQPYAYGQEWSWQDIDAGICTHVEPALSYGHGTTVAGIAAGDGSSTKDSAGCNYTGVAPDAGIIAVTLRNGNFLSDLADAVNYIFKKADALGKPCVINISYGTYYGSRDGCDMASQTIDYLLDERPGRAIVAAAGNAGHIKYHLGYEVTSDTNFTWFKHNSGAGHVEFTLWADTADFNQIQFAIGADDINNLIFLGRTNFLNVKNYILGNNRSDNLPAGSISSTLTTECNGAVYKLAVIINPSNNAYSWRFETTGSGRFDIWSNSAVISESSDMVLSPPPSSIYPPTINYKYPDTLKTMVSSFQNSDKVITVANYSNRFGYINYYNNTHNTGETPGQIFYTSSLGPTRDNRQKPDIAATGSTTIGTGNLTYISTLISSGQGNKVGKCGMHNRNGGTSMASPLVAGAVALYLEKNPTANWCEIKTAFTMTAKQDAFTGLSPNDVWGYGKLDAFAAILANVPKGCTNPNALNYDSTAVCDNSSCILPVYGCMDSTALNYDSLANVASGNCVFPIYGCMDSTAKNYNALANVDTGSCEYDTISVWEIADGKVKLAFYPNPTRSTGYFSYDIGNIKPEDVELSIHTIIGQKVKSIKLSNYRGTITIDFSQYEKGVYFYNLKVLGKLFGGGKIMYH